MKNKNKNNFKKANVSKYSNFQGKNNKINKTFNNANLKLI